MPTPPASVNSVATIKRDSSQQQLAQLQQYQQQQQQLQAAVVVNVGDNKTSSLARSVLVCRPNSHPFSVSYLARNISTTLTTIIQFTDPHPFAGTQQSS